MRDSVFSEQDLNKIVALTVKPKGNQTRKAQRILCRMVNWDKNRVLEFLRKPLRIKGFEAVELKTKTELIEYFNMFAINHQSFIEHVGARKPATLNYLENKYNDDYFYDLLKAINIHESSLSTRARNALQDILNNGNDYIIEILLDQSKIRRLKSAGLKTEIELITFCWNILIEIKNAKILEKDHLKESDESSSSEVKNVNLLINEKIQHLKPFRENIVAFLTHTAETLPTRAANGIRKVLKRDFDELCCYLIGSREILSIEGIGKRHENEINETFNSCLRFIYSIANKNDSIYEEEKNAPDSNNHLNELLYIFLFEENVHNFLYQIRQNDSGFIGFFSLYREILKSDFFIKRKHRKVFFLFYGLFEAIKGFNPPLMLERKVIAKMLNVSTERVRQILNQANKRVFLKNQLLLKMFPEYFSNYDYYDDLFADMVIVNSSFVEEINRIENAHFSINEVLLITILLLANSYESIEDVIFKKPENIFIKNELFEVFDFRNFLIDMKERVDTKRETRLELNFEDYLLSFMQKRDIQAINRLKPICEDLIFKRFGVTVSEDDTLVFDIKKNVLRSAIYDILKEKGLPMNISEIIEHVNAILPDHDFSDGNIRSTILRFNEFGTIGRDSTYYLNEWSHIKGGTIRELVVELLKKHDGIANIESIAKYVNKYRKTTHRNIISNLKQDRQGRFIFHTNGYVSLNEEYE